MKKTRMLVVSNHANHDLEWLKMTYAYGYSPENTLIYDRTPDSFQNKSKIGHLGKIIKSPNVGSNPYDIGRYIVDHYENLPDMMIHVKGNLLQKKYTTEEKFIYALKADWFVPIDGGTLCHSYFEYLVNDNWFAQPMEWEDRIEKEKIEEIVSDALGEEPQIDLTFQVSDAMQFAMIAISQMERIRDDDPERQKALEHVSKWIDDNYVKRNGRKR